MLTTTITAIRAAADEEVKKITDALRVALIENAKEQAKIKLPPQHEGVLTATGLYACRKCLRLLDARQWAAPCKPEAVGRDLTLEFDCVREHPAADRNTPPRMLF